MLKRIYNGLPGPPPVRVGVMVLGFVLALIALAFAFERAGDLIDSGGVIQ